MTEFKPALFIYFDGSFKIINQNKIGAIGFYIETQGGELLLEYSQIIHGIDNNTEVERKSLKKALNIVLNEYGKDNRLFIFGDEKTIIENLKEQKLSKEIDEDIIYILNKFNSAILTHISQCENKKAHQLANSEINKYS